MNKKCSNAMEYQSIGFHYAPVWNCKCSWRSSWTVNLVNALDGAGERWTSWTLLTEPVNGDGEPREPCERMYSNWVRVVFEPVSNTISKKIFLWMGLNMSNWVESGSKRSNAMEYQSNGFHYAPVWNCNDMNIVERSWRSSWTSWTLYLALNA